MFSGHFCGYESSNSYYLKDARVEELTEATCFLFLVSNSYRILIICFCVSKIVGNKKLHLCTTESCSLFSTQSMVDSIINACDIATLIIMVYVLYN